MDRLVRIEVNGGGLSSQHDYVYDLGGRVTAIRERAPGTGVGTAADALNRAFQTTPSAG